MPLAKSFQLGSDNPSQYFGPDLMYRTFHVPNFVYDQIHHYAGSYKDCLELGQTNSSAAISNQNSPQYFANKQPPLKPLTSPVAPIATPTQTPPSTATPNK
uniref:Related to ph-regulated antigen pra1 n=1 Tax=Melanopsichium pennsylvanicum 4 TaxID=1398559 RepID=A0A077R4X7_9BASI|nr:related to ph-regulated antigen pra1 precursor [Melanopsichium pennsylvanicum 4]